MKHQLIGGHGALIPAAWHGHRAPVPLADRLTAAAVAGLMLAGVVREVLGQTMLVSFGFYTLHIVDPAVVLCFVAWGVCQLARPARGGVRLVLQGSGPLLVVPLAVIAMLVAANFVRGMATGPAAALLWARATLALIAVPMLALTCSLSAHVRDAARRALLVAGGVLAVLVVLRLLAGPSLFMTIQGVADGEINDGGRPLSVGGAFVISLAAVLLLSDVLRRRAGRPVRALGCAALFAAELLTGQGTASIGLLAMTVLVLFLERGPWRQERAVAVPALLLAGTALLMAVDVEALLGSVGSFDLAQRSHNLGTREAIWAALWAAFTKLSLPEQLFGMPGGQIPRMTVYASHQLREWRLSIHSMYYGSLPVMGFVGLLAYLALLAALAGGLAMMLLRPGAGRVPAYPLAMVAGTTVLGISYEIRNEMLIGLFLAIWWLRAAQAVRR